MPNYKVEYVPVNAAKTPAIQWRTVSAEHHEDAARQYAKYAGLDDSRLIPLTAHVFSCAGVQINVDEIS